MLGLVKWFDRSYGFITGTDGEDYLAHQQNILVSGYRQLFQNQFVEFDIGQKIQGNIATNIKIFAIDNAMRVMLLNACSKAIKRDVMNCKES